MKNCKDENPATDESFRLSTAANLDIEEIANVRSYPVGNYLVFYVPVAGDIEIVRVIYGARDLPRIFKR